MQALEGSDRAVKTCERALDIAVSPGTPSYELATLHTLAFACTLLGLHRRAVDACMRQIAFSRDLGDPRREAMARAVLGDAYQGLGQPHRAVDSWLSAAPVFRAHYAVPPHYALCLLRLANTYQEMGKPVASSACGECPRDRLL